MVRMVDFVVLKFLSQQKNWKKKRKKAMINRIADVLAQIKAMYQTVLIVIAIFTVTHCVK